jgi:hypothetical protein
MYPKNAYEAFKSETTYRPLVWGIGSMPYTPREEGVEYENGELILYKYTNHQAANRRPWTTKTAIVRKPASEPADPYMSEYREVA